MVNLSTSQHESGVIHELHKPSLGPDWSVAVFSSVAKPSTMGENAVFFTYIGVGAFSAGRRYKALCKALGNFAEVSAH